MTRFVDRGAVTAAYVGIGMAITIAVSFILIIPIEPVIWLLTIPSGLLIGYYANQRSDRRAGPWSRILRNGAFAGAVTGLAFAALILLLKAIFFFADTGYPDFNRLDPTTGQVTGVVNGTINTAGTLVLQGNASNGQISLSLSSWNTTVSGSSMTGSFTYNAGLSGIPGVAVVTSTLSMTRR